MASKVNYIREGCHAVTPVLVVNDAARAIDFYKTVFGARERMRLVGPGGKIVHAEITLGDAIIMVSDEFREWGDLGPTSAGDSPVRIAYYVENVDEVAERAAAAGAKILIPVADQFYGDRSGRLIDPFGHLWIIATHKENVSLTEMQKHMDALSGS
jgi:PhnB protein